MAVRVGDSVRGVGVVGWVEVGGVGRMDGSTGLGRGRVGCVGVGFVG